MKPDEETLSYLSFLDKEITKERVLREHANDDLVAILRAESAAGVKEETRRLAENVAVAISSLRNVPAQLDALQDAPWGELHVAYPGLVTAARDAAKSTSAQALLLECFLRMVSTPEFREGLSLHAALKDLL